MSIETIRSKAINRRREARTKTHTPATLVLHGGKSTMICTLCDFSSRGARIKVEGWRLLPDRFELRLPDGTLRQVVARSRRAGVIGLRFLAEEE